MVDIANLIVRTGTDGVVETERELRSLERTADRLGREYEQTGRSTDRVSNANRGLAASSGIARNALNRQTGATRAATAESIRFNQTTRNTASNLRDIAVIGAVVGIGIGAGSRVIRGAVNEYLAFDAALTQVNTIARLSEESLKALGERAIDFASVYGNSSAEQARGYYQIISAGITDSARASDVWDASNRAAFAGAAELPSVIEAVTTGLNNYPDAFRDATGFTDAYLAVIERGQTTLPAFANNISNILPQARAAGVGIRDVLALYAGLTSIGISDPRAVTRIDALLRVNRRGSDRTLEARQAIGIQNVDSSDLPAYLEAVRRGIAGLNQEARNSILEDLTNGDTEAFSALSASIGGAFNVIRDFRSFLNESGGLTDLNLGLVQASEAGQVTEALGELGVSLERIGDALVYTFVPAFRSVADSVSFATENLETFFTIAAIGATALTARGIITGSRIAGPANRARQQATQNIDPALTIPIQGRANRVLPGQVGLPPDIIRQARLNDEIAGIDQFADAQLAGVRGLAGLGAAAVGGTIAFDALGDSVDATSIILSALPFAFVASSTLSIANSVSGFIPAIGRLNASFAENTREQIRNANTANLNRTALIASGRSIRDYSTGVGLASRNIGTFGRVVGRTGGIVVGTTSRIERLTGAFARKIPAVQRASGATIALRGAVSLLGGPIGVAIAGVGALGIAYALYGDRLYTVRGVNDEVTDSVNALNTANNELYQGYAQASLRTRPIVEGQYRVALATFDTTQEVYRQASANLTLLLSRDNLLRQERDNPNSFGQGQQGDLATGVVLSTEALTVAEANLARLGVLLGDARGNRERLRRELDNGIFPESGEGGRGLTGTSDIVNDLNLIQGETRELSDIFANNLTGAIDSASNAIGTFATDGVNDIGLLNEALGQTVRQFGAGLISDNISNTFRQLGQTGLSGSNGALQITQQGSNLLGIPAGGASGPFSASALAASQVQTQATLTNFFGSGFGATGFGTALSSFAAVVGPAAGLFGATFAAGQVLDRIIGRNEDVALRGTAGGGDLSGLNVQQRRSGISGFLFGRNNQRELSAQEQASVVQAFRPLFRTIDMIEDTSGRVFSNVMFSGESAAQAANDYADGVASQVGGVTRFNAAGESLIGTLDRLAVGTESTNRAFNRAGFRDLVGGEFTQGLIDELGGIGDISATLGLRTDAQQRRLAEQEIARQFSITRVGVGSTNQDLINQISSLTLTIQQQSSVYQGGIDDAQRRLDFVTRNAAAFAPSELIRARNNLQAQEDSLQGIVGPNLARLRALTGIVDEFALLNGNGSRERITLGSSGFVNEAEQRFAESAQSNPEQQRQQMIDIFQRILDSGTAGDRGIIDALAEARAADRRSRGL